MDALTMRIPSPGWKNPTFKLPIIKKDMQDHFRYATREGPEVVKALNKFQKIVRYDIRMRERETKRLIALDA